MRKQSVATKDAPAPVGPYSQAVVAGGFVFASGQAALDPETGEMAGKDAAEQTELVMRNLRAVLEAAGSGLDRAVKSNVYLADMNDFAAMNEVYARFFAREPPARTTVQAARLPLGALVEIEMIALAGE
ncbi:MAG TPA: RidA family protein [Pyrinomonadaceae bacterium]|nr:RidA family protein [Pyrinomonadaceae bacterium]